MNKKEKYMAAVIESCINGNMTVKEGARRLNFSERYVKKLKARYKKYGASSMLHGNCGKQPQNTIDASIKSEIIRIIKEPEFSECNFVQFQELLDELYNIKISYTPLYKLLKKNNIISPRKHKKVKIHNRRKRRETLGELLQVDATPHCFFENDKSEYCLHGFIDDATGQVTGLYISKNECMHGYLEVTRQTIKNYGIPLALYADGSSIFFPKDKELSIEEQLAGITKSSTQYSRMMDKLGVELIHAGSSQAKGRVERLWNTLHDRLITEFKVHHIHTIKDANKFLISYVLKYNKRFAIDAKDKKTSFMELPSFINLDYLLSVKYSRIVDVSNCISYKGNLLKIETKEVLHKKKIELCISKRIGVKVRYNDNWYKVIPIESNKKSPNESDSVEAILQSFIYENCLKNERLSA